MPDQQNKIPPHAKLAYKGEIFEVWQWEQKMFDGSTQTFECLRRPDTAQVIAIADDKILIQIQEQPHRSKPFPSIPGGRCGWDEEALVGAKRELLEETGYASDDWVLWKEFNPSSKMAWTIYTFVARNCYYSKPPQLDAGEKISTRLITFDEFLLLPEDPQFYDKELSLDLLRARLDSEARKGLRRLFFNK